VGHFFNANADQFLMQFNSDPQKLRKQMVLGTNNPTQVKRWIDTNEANCTKDELVYIRENVQDWTNFGMSSVHKLLNYLIDHK
jgi:hypothetical protein